MVSRVYKYVNSLACVRVKRGESECFRANSGVRQGCIISPCLFNVYMDAVIKVKIGMGRSRMRFQEGREWILPGFLYADNLVLCSKLKEDQRAMVGCFVEVCKRRGLKVNAGKRKMMVLVGEEGLDESGID